MMRKSYWCGTGAVICMVGAILVALVFLLRHEPNVYTKAAVPPGPQRQHLSNELQTEFFQLINNQLNSEPKWGAEFTQDQINSYLQEDLVRPGTTDRVLPKGVSDPRVHLETDKLRVAFRYGSGMWSTIVSVDLKVWVASKEPNALVIEVLRLRAGALPVSAQTLLEQFAEAARAQRMDVTWYRHQGNPVAVLRFSTDQPRASGRLRSLELQQGKLAISGVTVSAP